MEDFFTRVWTDLVGRVGGPLTFRIILQPTMAALLGLRVGLKDARVDRPAFLWTRLTNRIHRAELMREGWATIARVFVLAVIMDVVYQWIVLRWIYPGEAMIMAILLAIFPYVFIRGPANRIARRLRGSSRNLQPRI